MKSKQIDFVRKSGRKEKSKEKKEIVREISAPEEKKLSDVISSSVSEEKPELREKDKLVEVKTPGITEMSILNTEDLFEEEPRRNLEDVVGPAPSSPADSDLSEAEKEETNKFEMYGGSKPKEEKELSGSYESRSSQSEREQRVSYTEQNVRQSRSNGFFRGFTTEEITETDISTREDNFIKEQKRKYRWER